MVTVEGRRKLKLYHTSLRPESSESLAVWRKLLEDGEDHSSKEIHDALLLGLPLCLVFCTREIILCYNY